MIPLLENVQFVHMSEELDRQEIQRVHRGRCDESLVEQLRELGHRRLPVGMGELTEGMVIPNTIHGAEIGCHRAKILRFLLSQEPFRGRFHGPVAESVDRPSFANAEYGERYALVLLVFDIHLFEADHVLLGGQEGESVESLVDRGRHGGLVFFFVTGGFNFYRVAG